MFLGCFEDVPNVFKGIIRVIKKSSFGIPRMILCNLDEFPIWLLELTSRQDFPRCMSYNLYIRHVGKCSFYILVFSKSANTAIVGKFSFFMCLSVHIFSVLKGEGCTNFFMLAKHFI